MAVPVTRAFTQADATRLWELLNEIRGWIDQLGASLGTSTVTELGGGSINALADDGVYVQSDAAEATKANGYPADGKPGLLSQDDSPSGPKWQRYHTTDDLVFVRVYSAGAWGSWAQHSPVTDTGWVAIVPATGTASSDLAYRVLNGVCFLRGTVSLGSSVTTSAVTLFTLPVGARPTGEVRFEADVYATSSNHGSGITITTAGVVAAYQHGTSGGTSMRVGSCPPFAVS